MQAESQISTEHSTNNKAVRSTLISRGIVPENLPPSPEITKIERRLKSDEKKQVKKIAKDK